jgi:fatty-acyl-CoA synthase
LPQRPGVSLTDEPKASRSALNDWVRALQYKKQTDADPDRTLLSMIRDRAVERADAVALLDENATLTYRTLVARADFYSRWALGQDLGKGDVVCLVMPNCVDYIAIWLGITQVCCAVALINTNLVGSGLAHSIRTAGSSHIIVAAALLEPVTAIMGQLAGGATVWVHGEASIGEASIGEASIGEASIGKASNGEGGDAALPRIDVPAADDQTAPLEIPADRLPSGRDRALLIYTSGTTGAPKAAYVTHARVLEWSLWFAGMLNSQSDDRLYNCLPMYHSTGGVVAMGAILTQGGSVVIRKRFSASRFWDDVVGEHCTIFQYIGELCRYLLNSPPHRLETSHRLRLCCGNGLRGDVWTQFQQRFGLPRILEFYAATEGNVSLYNCEGKPGAIGRIPGFLADRFPVALIRIDPETGEILRDADGRCIRCDTNEPGEAIGRIVAGSQSPARHFDGYTDPDATNRKVLDDVFVTGDRWFRTGDLMRKDHAGYYYFIDRLGDTFRWKGENVSTSEVAGVVSACRGVTDAVVYGVPVPGMEGRAGMAAITIDETFRFDVLRAHLVASLPDYARPVFIRLCADIPITGTFKLAKGPLSRDGLKPAEGGDTVWVDDRSIGAYVRCNGSDPIAMLASRPAA